MKHSSFDSSRPLLKSIKHGCLKDVIQETRPLSRRQFYVIKNINLWASFTSSRPDVFRKKVFLEISQNSQENIRARASFFIKFQASGLQLY